MNVRNALFVTLVGVQVMILASALNPKFNMAIKSSSVTCDNDKDCGLHGSCLSVSKEEHGAKHCVCEEPYISTVDGHLQKPCSYKGTSAMDVFWFSLFFGWTGIDWFILGRNGTNCAYVWIGIAKLISLGGFGVWWASDCVRILERTFNDGNGMPLYYETPM